MTLARVRGVAPTHMRRHSLDHRLTTALTVCRTLENRTRMKGGRRLHLEAAGCAHQVSTNSARPVHTQYMLSSHGTSVHASVFLFCYTRHGRLQFSSTLRQALSRCPLTTLLHNAHTGYFSAGGFSPCLPCGLPPGQAYDHRRQSEYAELTAGFITPRGANRPEVCKCRAGFAGRACTKCDAGFFSRGKYWAAPGLLEASGSVWHTASAGQHAEQLLHVDAECNRQLQHCR